MKLTNIALSLVIPCHNEGLSVLQHLMDCEKVLKRMLPDRNYEIICVNDGSSDDTLDILRRFALFKSQIRVISYNRNQGKGYAVKKGVMAAKGKVIGYIDADGEIAASHIPPYFAWICFGADIICASKAHKRSKTQFSTKRRVMSLAFRAFTRFLFQIPVNDTQAGFKLFKKQVAKEVFPLIKTHGYAFDAEWLSVSHQKGFSIKECPVNITHVNSQSSVTPLKILEMLMESIKSSIRVKIICFAMKLLPSRKEWMQSSLGFFEKSEYYA